MSGTPFNDIYSGYFKKDETVTFDFIDFIKYAKSNSDEVKLPELNIKNVCNLKTLQGYLTEQDPDIFNKVRLNQLIEDVRYKQAHNLSELLNSLSFSNQTDMKTPASILEKMVSKLNSVNGIICDPCCGIGTIFDYIRTQYDVPKDNFYGIELEEDNVAICKLLGYKNVIQGDASDPKTWDELVNLMNRNTNKMKFDHIIMNPPYCRNLHLKILNEAINHSDDIVNLSPIRWLQDPLAEYKRNSDFKKFTEIRERIENIDVISAHEATDLFGASIWADLGVYNLNKDGSFDTHSLLKHLWFVNKVILKVKDSVKDHSTREGVCDFSKPYIKISGLHGHQGNKDFYEFASPRLDVAKSKKTSCRQHTVNFETEEESINFFNSLQTKFYKFINVCIKRDMEIPWQYTPWLDDYTHQWTDDDLYQYFELTDDEIKIIESEIK